MSCFLPKRQILLPHQVRLACKSPGMLIASWKSDSKMSVEPSSFNEAWISQERLEFSYIGGSWKNSKEIRCIKKKKIQKIPTILRVKLDITKKNLMPKKVKFGCK